MYPNIKNDECLICFEKLQHGMDILQFFYYEDVICCQCRREILFQKQKIKIGEFEIDSLYLYEGTIRNLMLQYKELYDEALAPIFLYPKYKKIRKKYAGYVLVPIPSSISKVEERGFHHVESMFSLLNLPIYNVFEKKGNRQQKELGVRERNLISFQLSNAEMLSGRKVLLIDDVMTTGNSMMHAYQLIRGFVEEVKGLTVCIHKKLLRKEDL